MVSGTWTHHWIFWVGPFTGAIVATLLYELAFRPSAEPVSFCLSCHLPFVGPPHWGPTTSLEEPRGQLRSEHRTCCRQIHGGRSAKFAAEHRHASRANTLLLSCLFVVFAFYGASDHGVDKQCELCSSTWLLSSSAHCLLSCLDKEQDLLGSE